ncbi:MAG: 50S ribosomal protein L1 [Chloroflexi bacterium]|nr:50S ribosomal protein L1 [Chloroflexota bacterium]
MTTHGKKYEEALKLIEENKLYSPEEAIAIAKKASYTKFDETVEVHLRTGLDSKHADQQLRGIALLPHGLGKPVRVLVFTQGEGVKLAEDAGADHVGGEDLIKKIEEGWLEFDVAIASPDMMAKVSKLGRILGRKGLMPNPKSGTVAIAQDLPKVIKDARKGRVEFKLDKTSIVHVPIGKASFDEKKLLDNLATLVEAIMKAKPSGARGQYIKSAYITTTMGPGIKLDLQNTLTLTSS